MTRTVHDPRALVAKLTRDYSAQPYYQDLQQEAWIGYLHAQRTYDPGRGASFFTHAYWTMRRAVAHAARVEARQRTERHRERHIDMPPPSPDAAIHARQLAKLLLGAARTKKESEIVDRWLATGDSMTECGRQMRVTKQRAHQLWNAVTERVCG